MEQKGFIFCFSNKSMPGLVNIGFTFSSVEERLQSANSADNMWLPPTPYEVEFAKSVADPETKYNNLVLILNSYYPQKGSFFQVEPCSVEPFFNLMDGSVWFPGNSSDNEITESGDMPISQVHSNGAIEEVEEPIDFDEPTVPEATSASVESIELPPLTPSRQRRSEEERQRKCCYKFTRGKKVNEVCGKTCAIGDEKYCLGHACYVNVAKAEGYKSVRQVVHVSPRTANNRCNYVYQFGSKAGQKCMGKGKDEQGGLCNLHKKKVVQAL